MTMEFRQILSTMQVLDLFVAVFLVYSLVRGLVKGLSSELTKLITAAGALACGWYGFRPVGEYLESHTRLTGTAAYNTAFILCIVGGFLAMRLTRVVLRSIMEFSFKGSVERVGGMVAGLLRGGIAAAVVLLVLGLWPSPALQEWLETSVSGRWSIHHLRPLYEQLSERYPDLPLPKPTRPEVTEPETELPAD